MYLSVSNCLKAENTVTVLAVPESPQNMTGFLVIKRALSNQEYLVVSTVGTKIEANFLSAGASYSGTFLSQESKESDLISK